MARWQDTHVSLAGEGILLGRVMSPVSSGAVLVQARGLTTTMRVVTGLTLALGDTVLVMRKGSSRWVTAVVPPAPAVPPVATPPGDDEPDTGDAAPSPRPTTTTGTLTCLPVATSTYRSGWRSDIGPTNSADLYQGRYSGSSYGRMTGVAFYGSKPRSLSGATVTRAVLKVRRLSAGSFSAQSPTLRLVSQSTRPGGAPTLNESTSGPSLKPGATNNSFVIPDSWAQAMVNGTRGGIAVHVDADTPYLRYAGRGSWSAAWTLTISWRRSS